MRDVTHGPSNLPHISQVYHALLRLMQGDHRDLVPHSREVSREALDIILTIMERAHRERLEKAESGEHLKKT